MEQLRWSPWSPCSKSCGGGEKRRVNHLGQTVRGECNNQPCPQPQWSPWSPCSKSCGKGQQMRINDADQTERRECSTQSCPLTWSTWSSCSATCGGGTRRRTRSDGRIENQKCNSSRCPFAERRNESTFPANLDWSERGSKAFIVHKVAKSIHFLCQGLCLQFLMTQESASRAPPSPRPLQLSPA